MLTESLNRIRMRLKALLLRRQLHRDLDDEIAFHLKMREDRQIARGTGLVEARLAAQKRFGNSSKWKESCRDMWTFVSFETLVQDARYGGRTLVRSPVFFIAATLTLALGIGANTTIFSMVDSFLLRPLPVKDPSQITALTLQLKKSPPLAQFSIPEFQDIHNSSSSVFSDVMCFQEGQDGLTLDGKTQPMAVDFVSGSFFSMMGIQPALGRFILPSEGRAAGADPVLVLGYSYWKTRFGGDPSVIGKQASVNGRSVTVIGVAPEGFHGTRLLLNVQGYLPFNMLGVEAWAPKDFMINRALRNLFTYARLKPGATVEQAQAELNVVADNISRQYPEDDGGLSLRVFPERLARPSPDPSNTVLKVSILFMILAGLVLVLACVNVANLLLVKATVRGREMALRAALGASRVRLVRQLLTESGMLALTGGVTGVLLGLWTTQSLNLVHLQTDLPLVLDFRFDWRVFLFAFAVVLVTGALVGITPALRASRGRLDELLRDGGRTATGGRSRMRSALVAVQVGGSLMLLIVAGLLTRSLGNAQKANLGFDPVNVVNMSMDPHELGFSQEQGQKFFRDVVDRVRMLPGVQAASVAATVPMGYSWDTDSVRVPGYTPPPGQSVIILPDNFVSPGYFQTMGIPLLSGRDFTERDDEKSKQVVIVNQAIANRFWPGENPAGRVMSFGDAPQRDVTIIGVARDSRFTSMTGPIGPAFYAPIAQVYTSFQTLQVRAQSNPDAVIRDVTATIRDIAPAMAVFDVQPMTQALNTLSGLLVYRFGAILAAALGGLGLVLALVGVYGVVSYSASRRTQEIGVRMALGANPHNILKMILSQGLVIIAIGLSIGIVTAIATARLATDFLVGVSPFDPLTYSVAGAALASVALLACYIPARRAMRTELTAALRYD